MVEKIKSVSSFSITYKYTELTAEEVKELIYNLNLNDIIGMFLYVGNEISYFITNVDLKKLIQKIKCGNIEICKSKSIGMMYLIFKDLGILSFNSIEIERMI